MSTRKTVIDAVVTGLGMSTDIFGVERALEPPSWWNEGNFPGVTLIFRPAEVDRIAFPHATADDMEARMPVEVRGYTKDTKGGNLEAHKAILLDAIETQLKSSTNISAVTMDVEIETVETDRGQLENHGICSVSAVVVYHYNHNSP
jgi:hypothetical protein